LRSTRSTPSAWCTPPRGSIPDRVRRQHGRGTGGVDAPSRREQCRLRTRARDRLYLSATVKDGVCRMGKGSLGEVLPAAVRARLVAAAAEPVIEPPARTGVCAPTVPPALDDFGSLVDGTR
jgi:hypothetical protein